MNLRADMVREAKYYFRFENEISGEMMVNFKQHGKKSGKKHKREYIN
jgi:hypothetical protein